MATKTQPILTKLTAKQVERMIEIPVNTWPGNCYGIADALRDKIGGETCYGNWTGPIAKMVVIKGVMQPSAFAGRGICHHAWIELGGQVIDPTRWVFEGVEPYIYYGKSDLYDFGGNALRDAMLPPPPDPDISNDADRYYPHFGNAIDRVRELLRCNINQEDGCTYEQLMWLANVSPKRIGEFYVAEVYEALIDIDMEALIPFDSRKRYAHE